MLRCFILLADDDVLSSYNLRLGRISAFPWMAGAELAGGAFCSCTWSEEARPTLCDSSCTDPVSFGRLDWTESFRGWRIAHAVASLGIFCARVDCDCRESSNRSKKPRDDSKATMTETPNKAPEPTPGPVTSRADARLAPVPVVAHL